MINNVKTVGIRLIPFVVLPIAGFFFAGCGGSDGPELHPVKGKVTYKGAAVMEGTVSFRNDSHQGGGILNSTGSFEIVDGLPQGSYKVYISPPDIQTAPDFGKTQAPTPKAKEVGNIPQKYRLPGTTDLEVTVKSGENDVTLDMQD